MAFLFKAGVLQTLLYPVTQVLDGLYHAGQFLLAGDPGFQLARLALESLSAVSQVLFASAIFFQLQDASQVRLGEPLHLLIQTPGRFAQVFSPRLEFLGQPGSALCPLQGLFDQGWMAK